MKILPVLLSDSYKQFHYAMYPENMVTLYSNGTPRSFKHMGTDRAVFFGLQYYIKEYLINQWNELFFNKPLEDVISEYKRFHKHFSFADIDTTHIEALHNLGYLPLIIKALPEGSKVKEKVPFYTIVNTHPEHAWLVNFLETQMSTVIWDYCVIATIGYQYRKVLEKWAIQTTGSTAGVQWQGHDFSMRGRSSIESTYNQAGWLLSFTGTDTIPAVIMLEEYYNANIETELVGSSVPASEHSVMTSYGKEEEITAFKRLLSQFPTGILSVVSDSFDLWKVCTEFMVELKDEILSRDGKLVIRPDSGDPVDIICGIYIEEFESLSHAEGVFEDRLHDAQVHGKMDFTIDTSLTVKVGDDYFRLDADISYNRYDKQYYYIDEIEFEITDIPYEPRFKGVIELLWDVFGGTINEQGYKVLDPHIGAIYGDSITLKRAEEICKRLEAKGFASTNIVFGVGSYTMNYNTRDSLGFAVKSTYCEVDEDGVLISREIFKDPITDDGVKKSAKGLLAVFIGDDDEYYLKDQCTLSEQNKGELRDVFINGRLIRDETLSNIRTRMYPQTVLS